MVKWIPLSRLTNKELVDIYNHLTGSGVTRFRDDATALQRTQYLLDEHNLVVYSADDIGESITTNPTLALGGRQGRIMQGESYPLDATITLRTRDNPKRFGSKAAARFALYRSGMTVAAYIAACVAATNDPANLARERARADLHWDVKKGYVQISPTSV